MTKFHCEIESGTRDTLGRNPQWLVWRSDNGHHAHNTVRRFDRAEDAQADYTRRVDFHASL